jgi:hypothetical protein
LEASDWRTSARTPQESQHKQDDETRVNKDNQGEDEESEQENVVIEGSDVDEEQERIASGLSYLTEEDDINFVTPQASTFGRVQYNNRSVSTNVWEYQLWEQQPTGELYKVTELTPVFGCSMGLRSDFSGC